MVPLYNFSISVILSRCTCAAAPRPADDGATRPRRRRRVRPTVESPPAREPNVVLRELLSRGFERIDALVEPHRRGLGRLLELRGDLC